MNKRLINKIQKLLNVSNGTTFEGEAETALKMTYQLMRENNITESDVRSVSRDEELGPLGNSTVVDQAKQLRKWEQSLVGSLAKLFDCKVISVRSGTWHDKKPTYYIVGREGNRVTTKMMFDWIRQDTLKKARVAGHGRASARNAYAIGVAESIRRKVSSLKMEAPKTDAWGIVPLDEVEQFVRSDWGKVKTTSFTMNPRDGLAYTQGKADGNNISLNRQFGLKGITAR